MRGGSGLYAPSAAIDQNPYGTGLHGLTDAFDWNNVRTVSNRFHATAINGGPPYDDSIMFFPGTWGDDVEVTATIYRGPNATAATFQEVEVLMCGEIGPHWARFYELMVSVHGTALYSDIARLNGPISQFDFLEHFTSAPVIGDGDIFKATKVGAILSTYYARAATPTSFNLMAQHDTATDAVSAYGPARYLRGFVGIGFWQRGGATSNLLEYGLQNVSIVAP